MLPFSLDPEDESVYDEALYQLRSGLDSKPFEDPSNPPFRPQPLTYGEALSKPKAQPVQAMPNPMDLVGDLRKPLVTPDQANSMNLLSGMNNIFNNPSRTLKFHFGNQSTPTGPAGQEVQQANQNMQRQIQQPMQMAMQERQNRQDVIKLLDQLNNSKLANERESRMAEYQGLQSLGLQQDISKKTRENEYNSAVQGADTPESKQLVLTAKEYMLSQANAFENKDPALSKELRAMAHSVDGKPGTYAKDALNRAKEMTSGDAALLAAQQKGQTIINNMGGKEAEARKDEIKFAEKVFKLQKFTKDWQKAFALMQDPEVRQGFGQNTLNNIANWTGTMTPKMAELRTILANLSKEDVHELYGGGLSGNELARAQEWVPTMNDTPVLALSKAGSLNEKSQTALSWAVKNHHYFKTGGDIGIDPGSGVDFYLKYNPYASAINLSPKSGGRASSAQVVKKQYNAARDQTKLIYSDGTEKIVDGR